MMPVRMLFEKAFGRGVGGLNVAGMLSKVIVPDGMPDWAKVLSSNKSLWNQSLLKAEAGQRILIATNVGGHGPVSVMESMLAVALTLRGAQVHTLLCDGVLPGCLKAEHVDLPDPAVLVDRKLPEKICKGCIWRGEAMVLPLGTGYEKIGANLTDKEKQEARRLAENIAAEEIATYEFDGLAVGEHAKAGALRYFARGDIKGEAHGEAVLRRYFEAALLSVFATRRVIEKNRIDVAVFHHGLYVPQGIVGEVCREMGVRVVNWFVSYRKNTFIFSHDDTYHHTLMSEPVSVWQEMAWNAACEEDITAYLRSRWYGTRDWISFHEKPSQPEEDFLRFAKDVGLDLNRPIIGMLSNVVWDAQLHYPANAFKDMIDWALRTIAYFRGRPDLQLLLRIHPAEIRGTARSRQNLLDEINAAIPDLPKNVFIIPPESPISTYAAMQRCNCVIIYGTKTGVELTSVGIPTLVAGEAWIRNKGLTLDASTVEDYFALLDQLPLASRLDDETVTRARKYAYHFFFRRMIPVTVLAPNGKNTLYGLNITKLDELLPGNDRGLDIVCEGIMGGAPFIYPAEAHGLHDYE